MQITVNGKTPITKKKGKETWRETVLNRTPRATKCSMVAKILMGTCKSCHCKRGFIYYEYTAQDLSRNAACTKWFINADGVVSSAMARTRTIVAAAKRAACEPNQAPTSNELKV